MRDLVLHDSQPEWVDVLVLARDEHRRHADQVQLDGLQNLVLLAAHLEVSVHQVHALEKRRLVATVVAQNLDHPVHHSCAHSLGYLVRAQVIRVLFLVAHQRVYYRVRVVVAHVLRKHFAIVVRVEFVLFRERNVC